jgi:hypothetical protein
MLGRQPPFASLIQRQLVGVNVGSGRYASLHRSELCASRSFRGEPAPHLPPTTGLRVLARIDGQLIPHNSLSGAAVLDRNLFDLWR